MSDRRCSEWREAILDHVANELPVEDAILLEQHLSECDACNRRAEGLRRLIAESVSAAGPAEEFEVGPAFEEALFRRIRAEESNEGGVTVDARSRKHRSVWRRIPWLALRPVPAYAVAILVVTSCLLGIWSTTRHDDGRRASTISQPSATDPSLRRDILEPPAEARDSRKGGFVVTPSDALCLIGSLGSDTL